jgi:hypothetical protein
MSLSGFPWKAKEDAVMRYFSKRSGEVESVSMINWSRDALPSGRSIVTFEDEASVQKRRINMQRRRTNMQKSPTNATRSRADALLSHWRTR